MTRLFKPLALAGALLGLAGCDNFQFPWDAPAQPAAAPEPAAASAPAPAAPPPPVLAYNFRNEKLYNWSATSGVIEPSPDGMMFTAEAADARINRLALSFSGADARYVVVDLTRLAPATDDGFDGAAYYSTAEHSFSNQHFARMTTASVAPVAVGERKTLVWDMHSLMRGGTDWKDSTVTGLRIDLDNGAGGKFAIHSISLTATNPQDPT